jgi:hypothetical protein
MPQYRAQIYSPPKESFGPVDSASRRMAQLSLPQCGKRKKASIVFNIYYAFLGLTIFKVYTK